MVLLCLSSTEVSCNVTLLARKRQIMPGKWDTSTKRLVGENPEHFIKWLIAGAQFKGKARHKTPNLDNRQIEADNLYEIFLNNKRCLVHIEFQSEYDKRMAKRMWEY